MIRGPVQVLILHVILNHKITGFRLPCLVPEEGDVGKEDPELNTYPTIQSPCVGQDTVTSVLRTAFT